MMNEPSIGDRVAAVVIFALAPLTGVVFGWVAALVVFAVGAVLGLLASADAAARTQGWQQRTPVQDAPVAYKDRVCRNGRCVGSEPHHPEICGNNP